MARSQAAQPGISNQNCDVSSSPPDLSPLRGCAECRNKQDSATTETFNTPPPTTMLCISRLKLKHRTCATGLFRPQRYAVALLLVLMWASLDLTHGQTVSDFRPFPPSINVAAKRPISTQPIDSTCGTPGRSAYCVSSNTSQSVAQCVQGFCQQTCGPQSRTLPPTPANLMIARNPGISTCVEADTVNRRPGSTVTQFSMSFFAAGADCFLAPELTPLAGTNGSFTITAWLWLGQEQPGTLLEKTSSAGNATLTVVVGPEGVNITFTGSTGPQSASLVHSIGQLNWTHLAIQVYGKTVSFFINGIGKDYVATSTVFVEEEISDTAGTFRLGQGFNGTSQFIGKMQDVHFYSTTLANREIQEVVTGTLPGVRVQTECRCPPPTPRLKPQDTRFCLSNGVPDNAGDATLRVSELSHPVEYANDDDVNTMWISKFQDAVTLDVDLGDQFEIYHVRLEFYSPLPKAITIERQHNVSGTYQPWQYFADNCTAYFNMDNNGALTTENTVNCIQLGSNNASTPYSGGRVDFFVVAAERPGFYDFYSNPLIQRFVQAARMRVRFQDHFYVDNIRHEYFALHELRVTGRCGCNGHAAGCSMDTFPYTCQCTNDSHTQGDRCSECQPLYNNKAFRQGSLQEAFDCQPCQCYGHADACAYNASLDPDPASWTVGGGGVCLDCRRNTTGQNCETCLDGFYRPVGKSLSDADVCSPCLCQATGTVSGQGICDKVGGQCPCKANVTGRACDQCTVGSYNLQAADPEGCTPCACNRAGAVNGNRACNQTSGECFCKQNVREKQCTSCQYGFYNLNEDNPYGCSDCGCNPKGSQSVACNPDNGQCVCKLNVKGDKCDQCADNFFNFTAGCLPCNCNTTGTLNGTTCDKDSGQCACKPQTASRQCNECKPGSFSFGNSPDDGCEKCFCLMAGIPEGNIDCTAGCNCKENVEGTNCNRCKPTFYNLTMENLLGCESCDCDLSGVALPASCDGVTGVCSCLPNRKERRCDDCNTGFFKNTTEQGGCLACDCNEDGMVPGTTCNSTTGECSCLTAQGVGGPKCDQCIPGYYNFKSGSCSACGCLSAGSLGTNCTSQGVCACKDLVLGNKCDKCRDGSSNVAQDNPFGCSEQPSQQPAPVHQPLSPSSMNLTWSPPDFSNGVIKQYQLFRNDTQIYTGLGLYHTDTGLEPYTLYSYRVEATNDFGSVFSPYIVFRTEPGTPTADMVLQVREISVESAGFSWNPPSNLNGPLLKYQLVSHLQDNETVEWEGTNTTAELTSLGPYRRYNLTARACTSGGCSDSAGVTFTTKTAPPTDMQPPTITALDSTTLLLAWKPPDNPNGIISYYELWIRGLVGPDGNRDPVQDRIFNPSGQYDPLNPGSGILPPPATSFNVTGLRPYTVYEFQVLAQNEAGRAASLWTTGQTTETLPVFMPAPAVVGTSSTQLVVSWSAPSVDQARGNISNYRLYQNMARNLTAEPFASPAYWQLISDKDGGERTHTVSELKPYTRYDFQVEACNVIGCVNSTASSGRTLLDAPKDMAKPVVDSFNSTVIEVKWRPPAFPNGPSPVYTVQKTNIALSYPASVVRGTRFPGGGYYAFPPDTLPQNVDFTGIRFEFRLQSESGLLMFAASDSQEEFVAVIFNNGRPRFMYDTNGEDECIGDVEVNVTLPENVNLTSIAGNGTTHVVQVVRGNDGNASILVDGVYSVGQGCMDTTTTNNDEGLLYNDNHWHNFSAVRKEGISTFVSVDGEWTDCSGIIGISTFDDEGLLYSDGRWHSVECRRYNGIYATVTIDRWTGCRNHPGVTTYNDEGLRYDRGESWHTFYAVRDGIRGTVTIDDVWKGTGQLTDAKCRNSKIIGHTSNVFIGGLPEGYDIHRGISTLRNVAGQSFQGCIHKVEVLKQQYPVEVWEELDWSKARSYELAFLNWQGCPINLDPGVHFMGKGYMSVPNCNGNKCLLTSDEDMEISLKLRTALHSGVLFFRHGGKGIYISGYLLNDTIIFEFSSSSTAVQVTWSDPAVALCDAQWHKLQFTKTKGQASISVDDGPTVVKGDPAASFPVPMQSSIYLGGIRPDSDVSRFVTASSIVIPTEGFGGCMKDLRGTDRDFDLSSVKDVVNINLDGCPPFHVPKETCKSSLIADIYTGPDNMAYDYSLLPYTDYIYRVKAANAMGEASSPWGYGRTREGAPVGVGPPTAVRALSGYMVEVEWAEPQSTSGLLTKTIILAYRVDTPLLPPVTHDVFDVNSQSVNITSLTPNTLYKIKISACTSGGCTESDEGRDILTPVEAPQEVASPRAAAVNASSLLVVWDPPSKPNGNLTGYFLYRDGQEIFAGGERQFLATQLRVYTSYKFSVRACTTAGCTLGPNVSLATAQLPPTMVNTPTLTVIGAESLEVRWREPDELNGVLERYLVLLATVAGEGGAVAYNNTDLFTVYTLTNLTAGTTHYVAVGACTGGGCTMSNITSATTAEGSPVGIAPPGVTSPSPTQLYVNWTVPLSPNGVITSYTLFHNDVEIPKDLSLTHQLDGLTPYSAHAFRIRVCTAQGCGFSALVEARTQEAPPVGTVVLNGTVVTARNASVFWTRPAQANGELFFDVYFEGLFYADPASWNYTPVVERRSLKRETVSYVSMAIGALVPLSDYNVQVNASNTKGFVLSNVLPLTMPAGSPDGMKPPTVVSDTPQSLTVQWEAVGRANAPEEVAYVLQFRQREGDVILDEFGPTTTLVHRKAGLTPYTAYQFRVVASNSKGSTPSTWVSNTTFQDKPSGVSPPRIAVVLSRSIELQWVAPSSPNGVITAYNIYLNAKLREQVNGSVVNLTLDGLTPYEQFTFLLEACTAAGCSLSDSSSAVRTLAAVPDGIAAPRLKVLAPAIIEIEWSEPLGPNGNIRQYVIERMSNGTGVAVVQTFNTSQPRSHVDDSAALAPYTTYSYRVKVVNEAGTGEGPWANVTTRSSRPAGVTPPVLTVVNATSLQVAWSAPVNPNGVLESYVLTWGEGGGGRLELRNVTLLTTVLTALTPYTQYAVTLAACTIGGCTASDAATATTSAAVPSGQSPPNGTAVSQSAVTVTWTPPSGPNGPNVRYELARKKIRQPLDASVTGPGPYQSVYSGPGLLHQDQNLSMFTTFVYRVTTFNDIGQTISADSLEVTTFGGFPRRAPVVAAKAVSHMEIFVNWTMPDAVELQGDVQFLNLTAQTPQGAVTAGPAVGALSFSLTGLNPSTTYNVSLSVTVFGGATITSVPVEVSTLDGAPEGIPAPVLSVVSNTALRVTWIVPLRPNGDITAYNIVVNGNTIPTGSSLPGSRVVDSLQPYTVYDVKIEACTVLRCDRSNSTFGTTAEALPLGMAAPTLTATNSTVVEVMWSAPTRPNGIILRYDLWRKAMQSCSQIPAPQVAPEDGKCTYVECSLLERACGSICFTGAKTCCDGVLHNTTAGHQCCGTTYVAKASAEDVCCAGKFHPPQPNFSCCGGRYIQVLPGETCCPSLLEDRVSVGQGDGCCAGVPYTASTSQICCRGVLIGAFGRQCCGGDVVTDTSVCCGNATAGQVYLPQSAHTCCGQLYSAADTSLCCLSDTGHTKAHYYDSAALKAAANEVCCGLEKISTSLSCCNYQGYNPLTQTCADRSDQTAGCGTGVVCPVTQASSAFCNRCDFDSGTTACTSIPGHHVSPTTPTTPPSNTAACSTDEQQVYTGLDLSFTDVSLRPHGRYQYSVRVINSAGTTSSPFQEVQTLEAPPAGVSPPVARINPEQLNTIFLSWAEPEQPNGNIIRYILLRDGLELFRGTRSNYTDESNVLPFKTYSYLVSACTIAGCGNSPQVSVATAQAVPEEVVAPVVSVLSATSLQVSIQPPGRPNGRVLNYTVLLEGQAEKYSVQTPQNILIQGLTAYTNYTVHVEVCTVIGCANSPKVTVTTAETAPRDVDRPTVVVTTSTSVDVYWKRPAVLNGELLSYRVIVRDVAGERAAYTGTNLTASVTALVPARTYTFLLEATTNGGSARSQPVTVIMPTATPLNVPPPHTVNVLSATEMFVGWDAVNASATEGTIEQYRVLLNVGLESEVLTGVSALQVTLSGLQPYTQYAVRLQACLAGVLNGCGTSEAVVNRTYEAPPTGLAPPSLTAAAADAVAIEWKAPASPNGVIVNYRIFQRAGSSTIGNGILINQVGGDVFSFTHSGSDLRPYSVYQYGVMAVNSAGQTAVVYATVTTLQSPPLGLGAPIINATGAYSVALSWQPPVTPNGLISTYKLHYWAAGTAGPASSLTLGGDTSGTSVSGLDPFTAYTLRLEGVNAAGSVSSPNVSVTTLQASPSGLQPFTVEKITTGTAVILRWEAPTRPNGVVTTYRVYEMSDADNAIYRGVARVFEFRRLQPFTQYTIKLEACTLGGCSGGTEQSLTTAEIAPTGQSIPQAGAVTATSVVLTWSAPLSANGKMASYEVWRRAVSLRRKRQASGGEDPGEVVYRTLDTQPASYQYTDTGLTPYTRYSYKIRATNAQGFSDSPWQTFETSQAAPQGVSPPVVTHVDGDVNTVNVTWSAPSSPNGVLQSYSLEANDSFPALSLPVDRTGYLYGRLQPFTPYTFTIQVCSGGGCTQSQPTEIRTKEAAPLSVNPPQLTPVDSTSIRANWSAPVTSNGQISRYQLSMDGTVVYEGLNVEHTASGLIPFKEYSFQLTACTQGGCTQSAAVVGRPEDSAPSGLAPPVLRVISSTAIEVSWSPPAQPNGVVSSYDVRRGGTLVNVDSLEGDGVLLTVFTDYNLQPGEEYEYTIVARNRKGSVESAASKAQTYSESPMGLAPPTLTPVSSTSIRAEWTRPANPNGAIVNFTLYKGNDLAYSGSADQLTFVLPGLTFFTEYIIRLQACTLRGCALSQPATAVTLEASPTGLAAPSLTALSGASGAHRAVSVVWGPPQGANGVVLYYQLQRRIVEVTPAGESYGEAVLAYNGTELQMTDADPRVLPFRRYQYMVLAVNTAGQAASPWADVTTKQAPPTSVDPPVIVGTTATTVIVRLTAPLSPNGVISFYNVLIDGTVLAASLSPTLTAGEAIPLQPFTSYAVVAQICTAGGCTNSTAVTATTAAAKPSDLKAAVVTSVNATAVALTWEPPSKPNGDIKMYRVYKRSSCPPPPQPFPQSCALGSTEPVWEGVGLGVEVGGLTPYTAYQFLLQVENQAGLLDFPRWVNASTAAAVPEYVKAPELSQVDSKARVDWTLSFKINGRLRHYVLRADGMEMTRGINTVFDVPRTSKDGVIKFVVEVVTDAGNKISPEILFDPNAVGNIGTTAAPATPAPLVAAKPWYEEIWFIIVIIIIGLLLLFILFALCLRRTGPKDPYIRERMPLPSDHQKLPRDLYVIDATDGSVIDATLSPSALSAGSTLYQGPGVGMINPAFDSSLPRLQTLSVRGSKSSLRGLEDDDLDDDATWDKNFDSGLFDDDDVDSLDKPAYSYTKEQTVFTDTHL